MEGSTMTTNDEFNSNSVTEHVFENIGATMKKIDAIVDSCNDLSWESNQGISLLDVKNDCMLTYLINLTTLVLNKLKGLSIEDVDTREKIVHMRMILDRILPIEEKMKHQIEKLVKISATGQSDANDKSNYRANLADFESNELSDQEDDIPTEEQSAAEPEIKKKGIYRPPKLAAVPYDEESKAEKQRRLLENAKKRALHTSVMQELKEEYLDTPIEITSGVTLRNTHTKYQKERESYEETYFTRLPLTKKDKHREKLMSSMTVGTLGTEITRFEDISALEGRLPTNKKRKKSLPRDKLKNNKKKSFKRRKTF